MAAYMLVPLLLPQMQIQAATTGKELYQSCQVVVRYLDNPQHAPSDPEFDQAVQCSSYIGGFTDALGVGAKPICIGDATIGTLVRVYVLYMQSHPKLMDSYKSIGVYAALQDGYPCSR